LRAAPALLEPAAHPYADGRLVVQPRFDAPMPRTAGDGPVAPDGAPLDIERFFDVASPEGVVVPFEMAWPGDLPTPRGPAGEKVAGQPGGDALQPPEYLSRMGGPEERELLEAPLAEEPRLFERPEPPDPPGFASPQEPRGKEPRAPGQQACTQDAHLVFPPAEPFLFTPQPPEARGAGGPGEEPRSFLFDLVASTGDPCPCKCKCVRLPWIISVFIEAAKLVETFFEQFRIDRTSLLGVSARPAVVVSTPDGFVEHVIDLVARRDVVAYGTPASFAPGGAAPSDGLSATFAVRAPTAPAAQRLLWPELDGTLAAETRVVAPVGPGPGLPGIGSEPLVPADGATFRAAPGSLPSGFAPAGDGFGPDMRGRS
jgi:hypothetical protein